MKTFMKPLLALLIAAPVAMSATASFASTAANTAIVNKAILTYTGGTAESSVIVKVDLVPALPNVTITRGDAIYTGTDSPIIPNTVTITSGANGPATYTISSSITASLNSTAPSVSGDGSLTIGASITAGTGGTTFIVVPAPIGGGITNNSEVNGIAVTDKIVFLGTDSVTYTKTVSSTEYDATNNTFKIHWDPSDALASGITPGVGVQVGETAQLILSAKPGTIITLGSLLTTTVTAVVTAPSFPVIPPVSTSPANKWTSNPATLSFHKYSRNVTTKVAGTGPAHANAAIEGNTVLSQYYYDGIVPGKTGDTIEYIIEVSNDATSLSPLTACAISDMIPTTYVTDLQPVYSGSGNVFYIPVSGPPITLITGAVGISQASYVAANSPNLIIKVGTGANNTSTGNIPIGGGVTVAYQVKIK